MDAKAIVSEIMSSKLTNDDLNQIVDAIKFARSRLTSQVKFQLRVGDKVKWSSSKASSPGQGTIVKIAIKYVTVDTVTGRWRVPANMLEKI